MRVNKEELKRLAEKSDEELWRSICEIGRSHGLTLPDKAPDKAELERVRRAMLGIEKISLTEAMKIVNKYKKQSK